MTPTTGATVASMQVLTTVLSLNPDHPVTRTVMRDGHAAHQLTMSGFAHLLPRHDFFTGIAHGHADHRRSLNVLFATSVRPDGAVMFRIQSDKAPDLAQPACAYWRPAVIDDPAPVTRNWTIPATGSIRYQIRANPTVTSNGRRRAINGVREQIDWWTRKAASAGLDLQAGSLTIDAPITLELLSKQRGGAAFVVPTLRYGGVANVVDPRAYRAAIRHGIGRARPYGAGLLLAMRAG